VREDDKSARASRQGSILLRMNIGYIVLIAVFILGLVILLPVWPWGRAASAAGWRPPSESAMSERNADALRCWVYDAEKGRAITTRRTTQPTA
jgi:hypothetical protein